MLKPAVMAVVGALLVAAVLPAVAGAVASPGHENIKLTRSGQRAAVAAALSKSDFASDPGWNGHATKPPPENDGLSCPGYVTSGRGLTIIGDAASVFKKASLEIDSEATMYASASMVTLDWKRSFTPALIPCFRKTEQALLPSYARVLSLRTLAFPHVAARTRGLRMKIMSRNVLITADIVFVAVGKMELALSTFATGVPIPMAEEVKLARAMRSRVPA